MPAESYTNETRKIIASMPRLPPNLTRRRAYDEHGLRVWGAGRWQ